MIEEELQKRLLVVIVRSRNNSWDNEVANVVANNKEGAMTSLARYVSGSALPADRYGWDRRVFVFHMHAKRDQLAPARRKARWASVF